MFPAKWTAVQPRWTPLLYADTRPDGHVGPVSSLAFEERDPLALHEELLGRPVRDCMDEAIRFGLKTIAYMKLLCDKMSQKHNMRFVLEQTPAESTAYRFAKLDLREYSPQSGHVVKGDISRGEIYYSNSTYLNVGNVMNPIDRVYKEGLFHPLIEAGSLTHVWLGESRPSSESLANFVIKVFRHSQNDQIAFSPEFTTCTTCGRTARVRLLLPEHDLRGVAVHLAASGDQGFRVRLRFAAPLLARGIGALVLENAFYGARRPANQLGPAVRSVSDLHLMGSATFQEGRVLLRWLREERRVPLRGFLQGLQESLEPEGLQEDRIDVQVGRNLFSLHGGHQDDGNGRPGGRASEPRNERLCRHPRHAEVQQHRIWARWLRDRYGARTPDDMLYRDELVSLADVEAVNVLLTVDRDPGGTWKQHVGLLPTLFGKVELDPARTYAAVVGPPVVYKFVLAELLRRGFSKSRILMSLERRMKCGVGKCGHCSVGYKYTCIHGPVFTYWDAINLPEIV